MFTRQKYQVSSLCVMFVVAMIFVAPAWSAEYVMSSTNFETPLALNEFKTSGNVTFLDGAPTGTYAHCVGTGAISSVTIPRIWIDGVSDITINVKYRTNRSGGMSSGSWVCLYIDNVYYSPAYIACNASSTWTSGSVTFTPPANAKEMRVELRMQGYSSDKYVDWDDLIVSGTAKVRTTNVVAAATYYVSTTGNDTWTGTLPQPNPSNIPTDRSRACRVPLKCCAA